MRDIFWGALIIVIGLVSGDSVFLGNFGILSTVFDGLGAFFIVRGIVRMQRAKQAAISAPPAPPPPPPAGR